MSPEEIEKLGADAWASLETQSEVQYVHDDDDSPYKPFYRLSTILTMDNWGGPPQLKLLGLRRHLTAEEAVAVVRAAHPWLAKHLEDHDGQRHFLTLFHQTAEMYDPEDWS
jgi:hypothetical protein